MESSVQSSEPTEPSDSSATGSVGVGQKTLLGICSSKELLRDPLPGSTVEPVEKAIRHTERERERVTDKPCDTLDSSREVCEVGGSEVGGGVDGSVTCEEEEEEEEENVCRETHSSDGGVCDEGGEGGSSSEKRVSSVGGSEESLKLGDSGQTDEGGGRQSEGEGGKDDERDMESTTPVESLSTAETVESPTEGEGEREAVKTGSEGRGGSDGEGEPMEEEGNECLGKVDTEDIEDRNDEVIGSLTNETPVGERGEVTEDQEVSAAAPPAKERDGVAGGGDTVDEKEVVECSDMAEPGIVEQQDSNQRAETTVGEKEDFELTEKQEAVVEQEDSENLAEPSVVEREDSAETGVGEQDGSKQISSPTAAELDVSVGGERVAADPDLPSAVPTTAPSVVSSSHLHQVTSPPCALSPQSLSPSQHHTLTSSQPAAAPSPSVSLHPSSTSPHSPTLTSPRPHTLTSPQSHTLTSPQSLVSPNSPTTTTDPAASPHSPTSHTLPSSQPHNVTSPRHHTLTPPQTHSTSSPQPESPSQPPTVTSSHPHTVTSPHSHTVTSSHPHIVTSSHPHTVTTSQLSTVACPTVTSSHPPILTSPPSHTVTSSLPTLTTPSAPDAQPANESSPSTDCGNEREPENEVGDERKVEADTTSLPEEKQLYSRAANTMEQMQGIMTETTVEPSAEPSVETLAVSREKEGQDSEGESAAIVAEMTVPDTERAVEERDKVVEEDSGRTSEMVGEEDGDVNVEERDAVGEGAGEGLQSEQREMEVRAIQPPSELTTLEEMKGEEEGGMEVEMEGEGDTRSSVVDEKEERLDRHNGDTESGSNPESEAGSTATGERSNLLGTTVTPCPQGDEASGETEEAKKLVETEDSSTTPPTTSTDSSDVEEKGEQESLVVLVSSASGPLQPTEGHTEQEEEVDTSGDKEDRQTLAEVAAAPLSTAPTALFSPPPLTDTGPSVGYLPVTTSQPAVGQSHENTTSSPHNVVVVGTGSTGTAASISPPPPLASDPSSSSGPSSSSSGPREKVRTELTQVDTTSIAPEKKTQVAVVAALAPTTTALPSLSSTSSTVHSVGDTCLIENSSINEVDSVETSTTSHSLKQDQVNPELPFATSSLPVPTVTSSLPTPLPLGSVPSTSSGRPDQDKPLIEPTQVDTPAPEENPVFVTTHSATISSSVESKRVTVERVIVPSPKRRASDPSSPPPPGSPPSLSSHTHTSGLRRSASDGASPQPSIPTRGAILASSEETVLVSSGETGVVHEATQTPPSTRTTFPSLPTAPVADVGMSPPTQGISSDRFCVTPPSGNEATPTRVAPSVATPSVQTQTMPTQHSSPVRAVASFSRTVNQQRSNTASVVTTPHVATSSSGSTAAHTTFSPFSLPITTTASPTNTAAATAGAQANTAGAQANTSGAQANTSGAQANTSGAQANTSGAQANTAGAQANTSGAQANTSGAQANTSGAQANTAGAQVNTAGAQANTAGAQATNTAGAQATNTAAAQAQFPAGYQPVIQVTPSGTIMTLVPTSQLKLASMQLSQQASTAAAAEKKKMAASSSSGIRPTAVAGMTKFDLSERKRALNMVHPDLLKVFGKPHFTSVQRMAVPKPQTLESTEMRKITSQQTDLPAVAAVASQTEPTTPGKVSSVADTAQPSTQGFKLSITTVSSSSSSSSSSPSSSSSSSRGVLDGGVESSDKSRQLSAPVARVPVVVGSVEGGRREAGPERAQLGGAKTAEKLMVQKAEILGACEYSKNVIY